MAWYYACGAFISQKMFEATKICNFFLARFAHSEFKNKSDQFNLSSYDVKVYRIFLLHL